MNNIQLAHGSGGQAMQQLINSLFMEAFANPWLAEQEDQARLDLAQLVAEGDRLAFSTDSYVIDPLFFPGGNIGKLAICGSGHVWARIAESEWSAATFGRALEDAGRFYAATSGLKQVADERLSRRLESDRKSVV